MSMCSYLRFIYTLFITHLVHLFHTFLRAPPAVGDAQAQVKEEQDAKVKAEAKTQRAKTEAENMAQAKAEAENLAAAARKKVNASSQATSKPKGFGQPAAMKKPPRKRGPPPPQKTTVLEDGMTADEAEQIRKARVTGVAVGDSMPEEVPSTPTDVIQDGSTAEDAEAVRLERLRAADKAAAELKKAGPSPQVVARSGKTNPLKQLIMAKSTGSPFPVRKSVPAPSYQRAGGNNRMQEVRTQQADSPASTILGASSNKNPLTSLLTRSSTTSYPTKKDVAPPSSQASDRGQGARAQQADSPASAILGASSKTNRLTSLLTKGGESSSTMSLPERKAVAPPSSQATSRPAGGKLTDLVGTSNQSSFPKRKAVKPPSSQFTPVGGKNVLAALVDTSNEVSFPKRDSVAPPSSQATSSLAGGKNRLAQLVANDKSNDQFVKRQAASAPPSSQAKPKAGSKLTALVVDDKSNHFPERNNPPKSSGSQATSKAGSKLTNLMAEDDTNPLAERDNTSVSSVSMAAPKPQAEKRRQPLTDLLPSRSSKRFPQSTQQKPPQSKDKPAAAAAVVKKSSLKDLLVPKKGQAIGSVGDRKMMTKLGGMANPGLSVQTKEERQQKMLKSVKASAAVREDLPKKTDVAGLYSSLSDMVKNQKPGAPREREGILKERTTQSRLGEMAKSGDRETANDDNASTPQDNRLGIEKLKEQGSVSPQSAAATAASKAKCAFQRALLSARIANSAKAKIFFNPIPQTSTPKDTAEKQSGLSQILQNEVKPTLSQQKAFANSNRRTSLFPDKIESKLSSLLKK